MDVLRRRDRAPAPRPSKIQDGEEAAVALEIVDSFSRATPMYWPDGTACRSSLAKTIAAAESTP